MLDASKKLLAKYGDYGTISTRSNGMTEFKLKKIPSKYENKGEPEENKNTTKKNKMKKNKTAKKGMGLW
jgi:hypothetical protein